MTQTQEEDNRKRAEERAEGGAKWIAWIIKYLVLSLSVSMALLLLLASGLPVTVAFPLAFFIIGLPLAWLVYFAVKRYSTKKPS